MTQRKKKKVKTDGGGDCTGYLCPRCAQGEIVYNGNYYCADFGASCDWALMSVDIHDPLEKKIDAVVDQLAAGLKLNRAGNYAQQNSLRIPKVLR